VEETFSFSMVATYNNNNNGGTADVVAADVAQIAKVGAW